MEPRIMTHWRKPSVVREHERTALAFGLFVIAPFIVVALVLLRMGLG